MIHFIQFNDCTKYFILHIKQTFVRISFGVVGVHSIDLIFEVGMTEILMLVMLQ